MFEPSRLPTDFPHKLDVARSAYAEMRIEAAIIGGCGDERRVRRSRRRFGEVRMVKSVEETGSEFEIKSLSYLEGSLQRVIKRIQSRRRERISRAIAERAWCWVGKRTGGGVRLGEIRELVMDRGDAVVARVKVPHAA